MWVEFRQTVLRRLRGQIIGWSLGLAVYSLMMIALFPSVRELDVGVYLEIFPEEMMAFFDMLLLLDTPAGYLDTYYFSYMTLILGIFVIGAGAKLLVGDEESGTLDLILAHPISRTALLSGRALGLAVATALILAVSWLAWALPAGQFGMDLTWIELLRPFVDLFALLMVFAALALLLSMVLPAGRLAGMVAGALLVGNYLLRGVANLDERVEAFITYTPMHYYQGGMAVDGLNWRWVGGLLAVALALTLGAWALFQRREIRVGGEHRWRLPDLGRLFGSDSSPAGEDGLALEDAHGEPEGSGVDGDDHQGSPE